MRPSCLLLACATVLVPLAAQREARPQRAVEGVVEFELRSALLSEFWGRDIAMQAGVVLPPGHDRAERLPVCYSIHGFGGSHRSAWRSGAELRAKMANGYPRMLYVFLNAQCPLGHHEFADSVNNGPWGSALTRELIPALEAEFGAFGAPAGRFLTGHSSGGWSSLWLQITYPELFNGTWSTAPDSVDFRDFTGIDVYGWSNAYRDPDGEPIQLMRRRGEWVMTIEEFVQREQSRREYGGQFASFDAVFSPRGEDGRPMPMFDRKTGAIDAFVAKAWEKYDIALILRKRWSELGPRIAGKLNVFMGTLDTFRLEGALRLMADDLRALGSDANLVFAEGRDHGSLFQPHADLWPDGMLARIHREMRARFDAARR
jgi:S-formylglutathione hydrolase FrmB